MEQRVNISIGNGLEFIDSWHSHDFEGTDINKRDFHLHGYGWGLTKDHLLLHSSRTPHQGNTGNSLYSKGP